VRNRNFLDRTGFKFGRLTAQWPVGRNENKIFWLWLCDCGSLLTAPMSNVSSSHTSSCGCFRKEITANKTFSHGQARKDNHSPAYSMWRRVKRRAKESGTIFDLSISDINIPEFCPVLGIKLERGIGKSSASSPSLDRIKPSLGYVRGNVHVISQKANLIKNDATPEELMKVANYFKNFGLENGK
jgi:hypothetical protein